MMKPILSRPLYFSLFVHLIIVTVLAASDSPPIYKPVEDITVNCGSSADIFNAYDNRSWRGDINSKFSPLEPQAVGNTSIFKEAPHSYKVQQVPYTTARLSHSEFTYRFFNLTPGQKFIRLYFYPASYPDFDPSKALFSVKAGGFTLLHDFNASVTAAASGLEETVYREFCMNIGEEEEEESLNITFSPSRAIPDAYAFINGIEIVSMPTNLYYGPLEIESARESKIVGSGTNFRIQNSTALQMVYRINIGGNSLLFKEDTGMYRNWVGYSDEQFYLEDLSVTRSVVPQNVSTQLNFSEIPAYTAPEEVYRTGRSMGNNDTLNESYNLTWGFPVDSKFYYLVRLHFCEFQHAINQTYDRTFAIYMDNQTAETNADIIQWSGGNDRPVYKDYLVFIPEDHQHLFLALRANPSDQTTTYSDVLLNGLEIFKLDSQGNLAVPNPVPPPMILPPMILPPMILPKKSRPPKLAIVGGVVISSTLAALCALRFLVFRQRLKSKEWGPFSFPATHRTHGPSYLCRYFTLAEIKAATRNFDDSFIIGVGGFGNVYKGCSDDEATLVAIKRLKSESSQGAHEFTTEIELLSQLRHRHLVSLIGYCEDGNEMVLVYDYMSRGTLASHLYHTDNPPLSWDQRLQICIGAAIGLHYLHSGAKCTIIHRDVKSTNILLNEKWVAKISDFGLSKMSTTSTSKTHISTMVKGSFGYLDPEYYKRQRLTEKSDVYSFGVVLCEVLCARPAVMHNVELRQINLAEWAKSCHRDGELDKIIDPSIRGEIEIQCLNQFVEIAISCLNDSGIERPSMNDVVKGLELAFQLHRNCVERSNEVAFNNDRAVEIRSAEPGCATNESIQCISETIFSEINDPNGR